MEWVPMILEEAVASQLAHRVLNLIESPKLLHLFLQENAAFSISV